MGRTHSWNTIWGEPHQPIEAYEPPDLSDMSTDALCALLLAIGVSRDPSDTQFAKACRDEIARRKPQGATIPESGASNVR